MTERNKAMREWFSTVSFGLCTGFAIGWLLALFLSGCAAFTGDFPLSKPENDTVEWEIKTQGNPDHAFIGVGAMPFSDGGPRWTIGMRDLIVRNRKGRAISVNVVCSDGMFLDYEIKRGREQWFMGKCALVGWR